MTNSRTMPGFTGGAAAVGFIVRYASVPGYTTADQVTRDQSSTGASALTVDYNPFGAKAMTTEKSARNQATAYAGLHALLTLPLAEAET